MTGRIDRSEGSPPRWVFIGGMIRSGSTLQGQVVAELVGKFLGGSGPTYREEDALDQYLDETDEANMEGGPIVVKTHICTPGVRKRLADGEALAFYTYRDIRDVVVSAMGKFSLTFDDILERGLVDDAVGESYLWLDQPAVHRSVYEEFNQALPDWIRSMVEHLDIERLDDGEVERIAEEFSLSRQKDKIDQATFREVGNFRLESGTLLHEKHIQSGASGTWRNALSDEQVEIVEEIACDWMSDYGYEQYSSGRDGDRCRKSYRIRTTMRLQKTRRELNQKQRKILELTDEAASLVELVNRLYHFQSRALARPLYVPLYRLSLLKRRVFDALRARKESEKQSAE